MSAHNITLKCGLTDPGARPDTGMALRDVMTGRGPMLWSGARTDIRLLLQNPVTGAAINTAAWALLTFRLLGDDRSTLYASRDVDPDDFAAGPPKETTIELTSTETTRASGSYWLAIFATLSAGGLLPLYAGPLTIADGGLTTTVPADAEAALVYTQAQVDALLSYRTHVRVVDDTAFYYNRGLAYSTPVFPIETPDGITVDGVVVIGDTAIITQDGFSWGHPVYPVTS